MTKGQMVNYTEILPNLFKNRSSITLSEGTGMSQTLRWHTQPQQSCGA